jgi:2-keto-4-pentenoate hydratase
MTSIPTGTDITQAAARLTDAARRRWPVTPVRDLLGTEDIAAAYAVQRKLTRRRVAEGAVVVGRKIGLTSR